jgi:hypothetical protein
VLTNSDTISRVFTDGDLVTFRIYAVDGGCYTNDSLSAGPRYMIRQQTPATPLVSLIGNLLTVNEGDGMYRWFYSPDTVAAHFLLIPGASGNTYHPSLQGYYFAQKDSLYCPSLGSNVIYISLLGVADVHLQQVKVFPNPTNGVVSFDWQGVKGDMKVEVYSAAGQGVFFRDINPTSTRSIDLSYLTDGIYYLVLRDAAGNPQTRMLKLEH